MTLRPAHPETLRSDRTLATLAAGALATNAIATDALATDTLWRGLRSKDSSVSLPKDTPRGGVARALADEEPTGPMTVIPSTPARASASHDELARVRSLRLQDARRSPPPASLAHLVSSELGALLPWKRDEARAVWQQLVNASASLAPDAAEALVVLTLALADDRLATAPRDATPDALARALGEARTFTERAATRVVLPRHRQTLAGLAARLAVLDADLAQASRWLAPLDPASHDLESDSAYRVARALLALAEGQPRDALRLLGEEDRAPFADRYDPLASVLRADALERLGRLDDATRLLVARFGRASADGRDAMEALVHATRAPRSGRTLALCGASWSRAEQAFTREGAARAGSGGRTVGVAFTLLGVGGPLVVVALVAFSVVFHVATHYADAGGAGLSEVLLISGLFGAALLAITAPFALFFVLFGAHAFLEGRRAARVRREGIATSATIVERRERAHHTSGRAGASIVYTLRIEAPDAAPYDVSLTRSLHDPRYEVGTRVRVRVDPRTPSYVLLEE